MGVIAKLDRALAKIEEILLALILVGMVVLAALQVLLRNIWNTAIDWADVSLQNATLLLGLLGAAVATSEGRHLNIDLISRVIKGRWKVLLQIVIGLFALVVCVLLTNGGWETYRVNYVAWLENVPQGWTAGKALKEQMLQGEFPQWVSQAFLPMGFGLIGFHFLLRFVRDIGSLITGEPWEKKEE
ncbi:MAG: TRAP transporter small permease subunit, partial [Pseudomonadota bacterium]